MPARTGPKRPAPTPSEVEASKRQKKVVGSSGAGTMESPLAIPTDSLNDISVQADQSLGHILSGNLSGVNPTVESARANPSTPPLYQTVVPRVQPRDLSADSPSTALKSGHLMIKHLLSFVTLARSYEVELEEARRMSTVERLNELMAKVAESKEKIVQLEKNGVYMLGLFQREEAKAKKLAEEKKILISNDAKQTLEMTDLRVKLEDKEAAVGQLTEEVGRLKVEVARVKENAAMELSEMAKELEAVKGLAADKARELEEYKAEEEVRLTEQLHLGFKVYDDETKEILEQMDPNFNWALFDRLLDERDAKRAQAEGGTSGQGAET